MTEDLPPVTPGVLDLSDPAVRAMADLAHHPEERWTVGGDVMVICETCNKTWRCPTRLALDALCRCDLIDTGTPEHPSYSRGRSNGCRVHPSKIDDADRAAREAARRAE